MVVFVRHKFKNPKPLRIEFLLVISVIFSQTLDHYLFKFMDTQWRIHVYQSACISLDMLTIILYTLALLVISLRNEVMYN